MSAITVGMGTCRRWVLPLALVATPVLVACGGGGGGGNGYMAPPPPPPAAPTATVSISPQTITLGQSATVTWSSTNAATCTASDAWSGAQMTSGTATVTPTTDGTLSYTLTCSSTAGASSGAQSAKITVNSVYTVTTLASDLAGAITG